MSLVWPLFISYTELKKMKRSIFALSLVFISALGQSAFSQPAATPATNAQPGRIVIVDTSAFFDEKAGITRIVAATKQVNTELAARRTKVTSIVSRLKALETELTVYRTNAEKGVPFDTNAAQAKAAEFESMQRTGKFEEDEYNALAKKRQNEIVGAQYAAAMQALGDYIKTKGYGLVFDPSKDQGGFLLFATAQYDITKDFIAFYNAKPVTTAAAVPVK